MRAFFIIYLKIYQYYSQSYDFRFLHTVSKKYHGSAPVTSIKQESIPKYVNEIAAEGQQLDSRSKLDHSSNSDLSNNTSIKIRSVDQEQRKRSETERRPPHSIRYDHLDHFPGCGNTARCKKEGCKSKTQFFCVKCKVHLCISKLNDCFTTFHILDIQKK